MTSVAGLAEYDWWRHRLGVGDIYAEAREAIEKARTERAMPSGYAADLHTTLRQCELDKDEDSAEAVWDQANSWERGDTVRAGTARTRSDDTLTSIGQGTTAAAEHASKAAADGVSAGLDATLKQFALQLWKDNPGAVVAGGVVLASLAGLYGLAVVRALRP